MRYLKNILLRGLLYPLLTLITLLVLFFFWGSSSNWEEERYAEVLRTQAPFPEAIPDTFAVITYNIGYLSGMKNNTAESLSPAFSQQNQAQILRILAQLQPDYLAMQEVDFFARRSHYVDQGATLAQQLGFPQWARAVSWDKRYLPFPYSLTGHFGQLVSGQALASQTPITTHKRIVLDKVASQPAYYQAFYLDRLIQIITTQRQGKTLALMNVHLDHSDEPTRAKQTQAVIETFEQLDQTFDGVILLGDFNSYLHAPNKRPASLDPKEDVMVEQHPTIKALLDHPRLRPAIDPALHDSPIHFTFDAATPHEKLDYIFYNPQKLHCLQVRRLDEMQTASDHLPIYARFSFVR